MVRQVYRPGKGWIEAPRQHRELDTSTPTKISTPATPRNDPEDLFPQVSWAEVHEHLVRRLVIEPEWRRDGHDQFSWWPWFLRQDIAITARSTHTTSEPARTDTVLRVTATTEVLRVADEQQALGIIAAANNAFPYGAFVYRAGVISATSSLALNPLCRGMLNAFHQAALIQATVAHQVALEHQDAVGVAVLASAHPVSGARTEPDELLRVYAGEECRLPTPPGFEAALAKARVLCRGRLLDGGAEAGFSNEEVDFFTINGVEIAVGTIEGDPQNKRFGPGLVLLTRLLPPEVDVPPDETNRINDAISALEVATQLGPVLGDAHAIGYGLHTRCYLDQGSIGSSTDNPARMAVEIQNAVYHAVRAVRLFLNSTV